jgi:LmbE family N-acetylglucosaminyl deacetylase
MELSSATIVVAHPDDEILWFSSIVMKVSRIIMCYGAVSSRPERAQQRRNVIKDYPLPTVQFLDLPEPGDVSSLLENEAQLALIKRLRVGLSGVKTVFTHNAWGEYGHNDHRRVNAAIRALQGETNFAVYVSSYVGRRVFDSFEGNLNREVAGAVSFTVDRVAIEPIFELYRSHSCWTWAPDWSWPEQENFFRVGDNLSHRPTAIPIQLIC